MTSALAPGLEFATPEFGDGYIAFFDPAHTRVFNIFHHLAPNGTAGVVLAIEPMVNVGDFKVAILPDKWTIVTEDGSLSAHFEHTVAITGDGPRILTLSEGD